MANRGFFYANKDSNSHYHAGDEATRKARFVLDIGRGMESHGYTRRRDVATIYQSALGPEAESDTLEQQLKARLQNLLSQSSEGQRLLDYQQRLYGK